MRLHNRYDFVRLEETLEAEWQWSLDGELQGAPEPLPLPPCAAGQKVEVAIRTSPPPPPPPPRVERWLTLRFRRKTDGHEVGWAQLPCPPEPTPEPGPELGGPPVEERAAAAAAAAAEVAVEEAAGQVLVRGARLEVAISARLGLPVAIALDGVQMPRTRTRRAAALRADRAQPVAPPHRQRAGRRRCAASRALARRGACLSWWVLGAGVASLRGSIP